MRIGIDARKIDDFGIGTYIRGLVEALVAAETRDEYVLFAPAGSRLPAGVEHVAIDAPHYSLRELIAVGRAADRQRLDVFHAPHYVVPRTSVPVVVTIHDLIHLHQPMRNPLAPLYARAMLQRAVRNAARLLTVSESVRGELIRELGAAPGKTVVTPNGVRPIFTPGEAPRAAEAFLFVGNDKRHKNVERLLRALAIVRRDEPRATLTLAGGSFERLRGRDGVDLRGFVSDSELVALYRNATALVMPSLEEGFGLPAAEAMACGTPVITSNAAALVEVTRDAALHADARDASSIASAMLQILRDASLRETLARRGVERARDFTWKRAAEITRRAYESSLR